MTKALGRVFAVEVACAVMTVAVTHHAMVGVVTAENAGLREEIAAALKETAGGGGASMIGPDQLRLSAKAIHDEAVEFGQLGTPSFQGAWMLTRLSALAGRYGTKLEHLEPDVPEHVGPPAVADDPDAPLPPNDRRIGYTVTVRGEYRSLVGFLRGVATEIPRSAVVGVRLSSPSDASDPLLTAVITTRHWSFDVSAPVKLAGAAGAMLRSGDAP